MNVDYKDFIGVFSEVFPEGFCDHLIVEFERHKNLGVGIDRKSKEAAHKHTKDDYQIFLNDKSITFEPFKGSDTNDLFFHGLQKCFDIYREEFSVLCDVAISCNNIKLQKTSSGGGYHVWHFEQGSGVEASRGLTYMLYLNALPSGANGETEFLYQQRRINPTKNTMVLWPAGFTHPHRGNPVYGDVSKYIATGWFYHE